MPLPSALDRTETLAPRSTPKGAPAEADAPIANAPSDDPERYEQVSEHARGGLGRVMRAVDKRLGRTVAVKELLRHDGTNEARFMREAMITARLEHPGIVPVHEAGRWPNGDPYYVMKLVEGRTLKELICARHTLRDRLGLLPHVIAIADAVGYAHSEGVIHRDLKPSNVIVGEFGETIVVDWGLARDRKRGLPEPTVEHIVYSAGSGSGASTVSGKVVGTPAYMSPEQARGELVDERADVYAIGALLYELLAGMPPHHDETPQGTLDRVIAGPPRPLSMIMPQVPSELATIVAKAMARCPQDRYSNASLLAEDLRRFHCGKLVSAHSYTAWSLLRKKLSHHRGAVVVAIASMVTLAAVGVASVRRVVAERNIAQHERERAVSSQGQTEHRQRELMLLQAETSLRKDPTATVAWLKTFPIGDADRAHVLGVLDEAVSLGVARHVFRTSDWVFDVDFTPDGNTIVAAVRDRVVRAYDVRTGEERQLGIAESTPEMLAMAPDGRFAVTSGMLGEVTLWPLDGGPSRVLSRGSRVRTLRLSPDGGRVLVVRDTGAPITYSTRGGEPVPLGPPTTLRTTVADADWSRQVVVDSLTRVIVPGAVGEPQRVIATTAKAIHRISMSPRGDRVLIHDGEAIWIVPFTGETGPLRKLVDYDSKLAQAVWSPDEQTIALGGDVHDILLVDVGTGAVRQLRGHTDANYALQWSRDGRRLLSASDDATARVWTIADGSSLALRGHDDDVFRARFSFDERSVVTASFDGTIRIWCVEHPGSRMLVEGDEIERLAVEGDRALVKTSKEIAWWNLASGHRIPVFSWAKERGLGLAMASPDGEHLFVPNADGSAELRHRAGPTVTLRGHRAAITNVEFSRDSKWLFTASRDGTFRRWDVATGEGSVLLERESPVRRFAVAADGRIALVIDDELMLIRPDGTGRVLGAGPRWAGWVEFERVQDRMVLRRTDGSFAMLDGERVIELPTGGFDPTQIAVSPDGKRIAGPLSDRTVRVWDAETGRVIDILRGHTDLVMDVAFSPDGAMLASASYDKTVRIWQLGANQVRVLRGHTGPVHEIEWWQPHRIVTGSRDGTLRIWDVPSMELPTARELADRMQRATTARIDIDRPTTGAAGARGI